MFFSLSVFFAFNLSFLFQTAEHRGAASYAAKLSISKATVKPGRGRGAKTRYAACPDTVSWGKGHGASTLTSTPPVQVIPKLSFHSSLRTLK